MWYDFMLYHIYVGRKEIDMIVDIESLIKLLQDQVTLNALYYAFAFLVFMDVVTGVLKAWKSGSVKSRTLKDGLFNSVGEMLVLFLCIVGSTIVPLIGMPVFIIMVFMNLKELTSVFENLAQMGVHLPKWIVKGLYVYTSKLDSYVDVKETDKDKEVK